jgi:glycosyltransferase involved in cell wall biosynthesis
MKICIINNFPPYSGVGRVTYEFWRDIQKIEGVQADLYCTHAMTDEELEHEENKDVKFLHNFTYKGNEYLSRFHIYFLDRYKLPKGYDIYHFSNHMLSFMINKKWLSVVTVFDVLQLFNHQDKDLNTSLINKVYNWLIRKSVKNSAKADALICVSKYTQQETIKLIGVDPHKTYVVHTGLDLNLFSPKDKYEARKELNLPIDKNIVLHVGSEIPRKNVDTILKSISKCDENTVLVRVGTKSEKITSLINELDIKGRVINRESFIKEDVAKYYSAADVMAFPSFAEGFGLPIIEAMACGCPVITSNFGAMKEIAGNGALLINPNNTDELTNAIKRIFSLNENEKASIVKKGLKRASSFTSENYTKEVINVYRKLLNNR